MSLLSLPAEILNLTFAYLPKIDFFRDGTNEFASLARSCRYLNALVTPSLYKRINTGPKAASLLVRSILEKPVLALYVKEAILMPSLAKNGEMDLGRAYTMLRKPGLLPKACTRHLHPSDGDTITLLIFEVLLLRISEIEELTINMLALSSKASLFGEKRWKAGKPSLPARLYPYLRRFDLYMSSEPPVEVDVIAQARNLITMSEPPRLYIELPHPFQFTCDDLKLPSVQEVELFSEGMTRENLVSLLECCPNMRSFEYYGGTGPSEWHPLFEETMGAREICQVLQTHQHKLDGLKVHLFYEEDAVLGHDDTIPDLSKWTQFKELQLDAEALRNVPPDHFMAPEDEPEIKFLDKFPPSLESLRIFRADERHLKELKYLASRKAQDFPNMNILVLEWWSGESFEEIDALDITLRNCGIKLRME